jgi:hypothetical protein
MILMITAICGTEGAGRTFEKHSHFPRLLTDASSSELKSRRITLISSTSCLGGQYFNTEGIMPFLRIFVCVKWWSAAVFVLIESARHSTPIVLLVLNASNSFSRVSR